MKFITNNKCIFSFSDERFEEYLSEFKIYDEDSLDYLKWLLSFEFELHNAKVIPLEYIDDLSFKINDVLYLFGDHEDILIDYKV